MPFSHHHKAVACEKLKKIQITKEITQIDDQNNQTSYTISLGN